jgi:1-acyl-sn-glycerol-3-phosphate acyltransferase
MSSNIQKQIPNVCKAIYRSIKVLGVVTSLTAFVMAINVLQVNFLLLLAFHRAMRIKVNSYLGGSVLYIMQLLFEYQGGRISISGDEIPQQENALVFSNHSIYY